MSESKNSETAVDIIEQLKKITPDVFQSFLRDKGIPLISCPCCRRSDMSIPLRTETTIGPTAKDYKEQLTHIEATATNRILGGKSKSPFDYEYNLFCKNCGYVSKFSVYPLLKWMNDKDEVDND